MEDIAAMNGDRKIRWWRHKQLDINSMIVNILKIP